MTRLRDILLPGVLGNEWGMNQRDLEVARQTVRPRSECPHCHPERNNTMTTTENRTKCPECEWINGQHDNECYHADCDSDDWPVHECGPTAETAGRKVT